MSNRTKSILLISIGVIFTFIPIFGLFIFDKPLSKSEKITFQDKNNNTLNGTYVYGSQPYGVILVEGFGSDQITMKSLASEFARNQWNVFTFDFSGHGRSPETLTFDNASTDRLAYQTLAAIQEFSNISNLSENKIFLIGHSLGARVALQTSSLNSQIAGLILLGTQVNLASNLQSEFFTGTSDNDLPWVLSLGPETPKAPILMISGSWDDILPPKNAEILFNKLTSGSYDHKNGDFSSTAFNNPVRHQRIIPNLVHNYEPFSPIVIDHIMNWLNEQFELNVTASKIPIFRIWTWILSLPGIFLLLIGGKNLIHNQTTISTTPGIKASLRKFFGRKLLLWIAALPIALVLGSVLFVLPIGKPVLNLIYVSFIGGYGILLLMLYQFRKIPGVDEKFFPKKVSLSTNDFQCKGLQQIILSLVFLIGVLFITAAYTRTGWFYVFPVNLRLIWLFIFTPFTALGFWIGMRESEMLPDQFWPQLIQMVIGLFPFILYTIFMAAIGSLSGMIGGFQGLIILWLVLVFGKFLNAFSRLYWLSATCMAVLLYWLILPQGVLF